MKKYEVINKGPKVVDGKIVDWIWDGRYEASFATYAEAVKDAKAFRNSVAYIDNWLQALKNDRKMIVGASSKAEAAVKYIINGKQNN